MSKSELSELKLKLTALSTEEGERELDHKLPSKPKPLSTPSLTPPTAGTKSSCSIISYKFLK